MRPLHCTSFLTSTSLAHVAPCPFPTAEAFPAIPAVANCRQSGSCSLMAMAVTSLTAAPGFLSRLPGEPPNNVSNCCCKKSWQSESKAGPTSSTSGRPFKKRSGVSLCLELSEMELLFDMLCFDTLGTVGTLYQRFENPAGNTWCCDCRTSNAPNAGPV